MPEKPKAKAKNAEDEVDEDERSSWSDDQKKREYYYDDAHGYEVFEPDEDNDAEARV